MQGYFKEIFDHAYIEFIIDSSKHPQRLCTAFSSSLHNKWTKYAKTHFTSMFNKKKKANAFIDGYKTEKAMYNNYIRWFKQIKMKHKKTNAVYAFKKKAHSSFSQWYVDKKKIKDLSVWKYTGIGPWFTAVQKSNLSKYMRDKSHENKGQHLHKKSNGSNTSTTNKKRKLYQINNEVCYVFHLRQSSEDMIGHF